jgi:hypothetical protein
MVADLFWPMADSEKNRRTDMKKRRCFRISGFGDIKLLIHSQFLPDSLH